LVDYTILIPAIIVVLIILSQAIKIVKEYERVVVFRLGRFLGVKGPGLFIIIPIVDTVVKVDLRVVTIDVPKQAVITLDNVTIDVDAVVYYRVTSPGDAVTAVENYKYATAMLSQTTLRDVLGQVEFDDVLSKRDEINQKIQDVLDSLTDPWGIKVTNVTIRDVVLPESMYRAIARQAEAEREKRARTILADGEYKAAQKNRDAGQLYQEMPAGLKLRELQTYAEISREKNMIVVTDTTNVDTGKIAALSNAVSKGSSGKKDQYKSSTPRREGTQLKSETAIDELVESSKEESGEMGEKQ
jgi:regulator of protease activity HflC (stomatin/prohibitin superfamily)